MSLCQAVGGKKCRKNGAVLEEGNCTLWQTPTLYSLSDLSLREQLKSKVPSRHFLSPRSMLKSCHFPVMCSFNMFPGLVQGYAQSHLINQESSDITHRRLQNLLYYYRICYRKPHRLDGGQKKKLVLANNVVWTDTQENRNFPKLL